MEDGLINFEGKVWEETEKNFKELQVFLPLNELT